VSGGHDSRVIAMVSGKGGVGKTNMMANIAVAAAGLGKRVLLVDGDLGLANVDVLFGLTPRYTAADVISGGCCFEDALVAGPRGVFVLPAASGRSDLPGLRAGAMAGLLVPLFAAAPSYDLVLVDAGAGIGSSVISLAAASQQALLLITPEPTCLADAYATLKVLDREVQDLPVDVLVNQVRDELHARDTHSRLERMASRFLDLSPGFLGWVPRDPRLLEAVARQRAVVEAYPTACSSRRLIGLAQQLLLQQTKPRLPVAPAAPSCAASVGLE